MYPRLIEVQNAAEAASVEQALAMVRELERMADDAPDGHVIAQVEQAALDRGRRFTRDRLQDVLNRQAQALEKKGGAAGPALVAGPGEMGVLSASPGLSQDGRLTGVVRGQFPSGRVQSWV